MKTGNIVLIYILATIAILSCGEDRTHEFFEMTKENQWIYTTMRENYLWKDKIQPQERSKFFTPSSKFFSSLLYKDDKASFFTDSVYNGDYGISFTLMRDPIAVRPSRVYALVLFVEPGSPAAHAGVERGTWLSAANGKDLSMSSSSSLKSGEGISLSTEYIEFDEVENKNIWIESDTLLLSASTAYDVNDIYIDSVYTVRDKNVGYIMCNSFNKEDFVGKVNNIAEKFNAQNVTDVIVDLRYNTGGTVSNASYLASMFVDSDLVGTPFCTLKKNENEVDTVYNYVQTEYTLRDKRVYFITGSTTKGTAELLVASLDASKDAYDIIVVGEATAGSNVMVEKMDSPYGFSINPATAYVYTSGDKTITKSGINPDYELNELEQVKQQIYPLGNEQEYMLYNTTYIILNGTLPSLPESNNVRSEIFTPQRGGYIR